MPRPPGPGRLAAVQKREPERAPLPEASRGPFGAPRDLRAAPEVATAAVDPRRAAASRLVEHSGEAVSRGRLADAAELLERAVALDPAFSGSYVQLARLHLVRGDHELALAFLDKAEELAAGDTASLSEIASLRGMAFEGLGRLDAARHAYERALELAPENPRARDGMRRAREAARARE